MDDDDKVTPFQKRTPPKSGKPRSLDDMVAEALEVGIASKAAMDEFQNRHKLLMAEIIKVVVDLDNRLQAIDGKSSIPKGPLPADFFNKDPQG